jgi:glutamate dehydrogenase/leucine dehydrogenase
MSYFFPSRRARVARPSASSSWHSSWQTTLSRTPPAPLPWPSWPRGDLRARPDLLAPCALGDAIHEGQCRLGPGGGYRRIANNVFPSIKVADRLQQRGRVYAVVFIANAGGTIYDDQMVLRPRPRQVNRQHANAYLDGTFNRTLEIFDIAAAEDVPLWQAAQPIAERNLAAFSDELARRRQRPGKPQTL